MPAAAILNVVLLIILLLALGLSGTGFGLFAHNNGATSICFLNFSTSSDTNYGNRKLCNTSLAGYIIATICIAAVTLMELNKLVHGKAINTIGNILQIALLAISTVFLLISGVSVAVGWAKTCKNIKDDGATSCNISDDNPTFAYINEEMIASAVCTLLGMIFTMIATPIAVIKAILTRNDSTNLEEKVPIMKYETNKDSYNQ